MCSTGLELTADREYKTNGDQKKTRAAQVLGHNKDKREEGERPWTARANPLCSFGRKSAYSMTAARLRMTFRLMASPLL